MERVRNKNQHYDAWLHWNVSSQCNFACKYCFGKTAPDASTINTIDIGNLLNTLNKTGKIFRISFTGGEPFLIPNIIESCSEITDKHFVSFNTNLVLDKVIEFAETIDPERVLNVHASLHIEELVAKKLMTKFTNNFHLLLRRGYNVYAEVVAYPGDIQKINKYKSMMLREGIEFSFAPFYGRYMDKSYPETYSRNEIELFNLNPAQIAAHRQKGNCCNAGFNAAVVSPSGKVSPCFQVNDSLGNIYSGFSFNNQPIICPAQKCGCPLNFYDNYLYKKANDLI